MNENAAQSRRVVAGVDSSDDSTRAALWAARYAAELGLSLHLVHALNLPGGLGTVIEPPDFAEKCRADGRALLERVAAEVRADQPQLEVGTEISELDPAHTLVQLSTSAHTVVTGTRGHGGFAGLLLGSVSLKLAVHAACPAVVVRGESGPAVIGEIVVGIEPGQHEAPIRFAFDLALAAGAEVRAVRAWWPYPMQNGRYYLLNNIGELEKAQQDGLETVVDSVRADYPQVKCTTSLIRGNAVPVLGEAGRGTRLVVIGAHRSRGPLSVGAGYVVQGLLSHSSTPVAVVPIR